MTRAHDDMKNISNVFSSFASIKMSESTHLDLAPEVLAGTKLSPNNVFWAFFNADLNYYYIKRTKRRQISIEINSRFHEMCSRANRLRAIHFRNIALRYFSHLIIHRNVPCKLKVSILPILSTCALHTNSGCGKREAHINWSMVTCKMAAPVTGTALRTTGPVPEDSRQ